MTRASKFTYTLSAIFVIVILILSSFVGGGVASYATVSASEFSDVLSDLKKDSSFSEDDYPVKSGDYSLQIIQVAESVNSELFIYVYQPSGQEKNLTASSINISITINDDINFHNYKLQLLNSDGVFFKYLVQDFTVSTLPTRFYVISTIYRPYDEKIDEGADHGNIITEVDYEVSKQYCFSTINGNPYVQVVDIETITITDKYVGFVRYSDGHNFWGTIWGSCDSHFVAFNTDRPIDRLLEADVYYTKQSYSKSIKSDVVETFGAKNDGYAYLKYTDIVEHTGSGWGAPTYKWNRIETVEQFISENDLTQNVYSGAIIDVNVANKITDEGKKALQDKTWLLRFVETDYSYSTSGSATMGTWGSETSSTLIGDVTILRLKFETDGITYNLGTIDNKQTGSRNPINDENSYVQFNGKVGRYITMFLAVIALIIVGIVIFFCISKLCGMIKDKK